MHNYNNNRVFSPSFLEYLLFRREIIKLLLEDRVVLVLLFY